eukprot:TRINITY_DN29334_c0_g1_i1.p1 TRINITY_DN29334_c0_g1~~TRINITY_DN29334_c0_g1_i1.p1  ORF type:complete len:442 (-),score=75.44 TRINITY_DN29334_c0_g1_i1:117-1442(-)
MATNTVVVHESEVIPQMLGHGFDTNIGSCTLRNRKNASDVNAPSQVPIPLETVPMGKPVIDCDKGWSRLPAEVGSARRTAWEALKHNFSRFSPLELAGMKQGTRNYYNNMYSLIDNLESADIDEEDGDSEESSKLGKASSLIYVSFLANVIIFAVKVSVAISSGALVIYASALDSFLDLLSGSILSITAWIMSKPALEKYPIGKSRMEPLGVVVFAAIMGTCYAQVIVEAVTRSMTPAEIECSPTVIGLLLGIVICKALLWIVCRLALAKMKRKSSALEAQAEDHFNDCLTNLLSAVGTFFASSFFARLCGLNSATTLYFIDPCVAALFSSYVIYAWVMVARENIVCLVGHSAPSELINRITYLAAVHCSEVIAVDTIRCYSFGHSYIAEVDIVLPPEMPNQQAHDIGESLQIRIESLEEIHRCFVHIDWETTHKPEHKAA